MRTLAFFLLLFLASSPEPRCLAFEIFPEFHSLGESEVSGFDLTTQIDSEYQSDVNIYHLRQSWDAEFFSRSGGLNLTLGSLSNIFFLQQSRLRLSHRLLPALSVRFTYFQDRDLTTDQNHAIFELVQNVTDWFSVSAYGEPSLYKRENTFGAALLFFPAPESEIRLFHSWVHFTRNEHNDRPDYFVSGSEATAYGVAGRHWAGEADRSRWRWLEYFVRRETPTLWRFPQGSYDYAYEAFSAGISALVALNDARDHLLHLRLQATRKFEGYAPLTASSTVSAASSLDRRSVEALITSEWLEVPVLGTIADLEAGLGWFQRRWVSGAGELLDHRNLTPIFWLRLPGPARADRRDVIALGYDATLFIAEGEPPLASPQLKHWTVEHRANLRYTFSLQGRSEFGLLVSADLDSLVRGSGGLFEGGQGEFKTFF